MRLLALFLLTTALGAVEIEGLPKDVIVDPKEILADKKFEILNVGYVTNRMRAFGYLNATTVMQDDVMKATPGNRYTIREVTIKDGTPEVHQCEIPVTPENMQLLQRIFDDCEWDRSINERDKSIHYTLTPK